MGRYAMALPDRLRDRMLLPAVCAPMFLVSGPDLVEAACRAGIVGALPRANARDIETFEAWLKQIRDRLDRHAAENPGARIGPLAVNLATRMQEEELRANLDLCGKIGRASGRERVCQYVYISVGAVSLKKKKTKK